MFLLVFHVFSTLILFHLVCSLISVDYHIMAETSAHTDSTQTPAFVYCIHPSDHANLKLVNNVFDGVGFGDWKLSMMIGLTAKNKMCFVDGILPKLSENDPNRKA